MMKSDTKKQSTKHNKAEFHFRNVVIKYDLPNQADVYYLTDDNEYNKWVNGMMIDLWYKRLRLEKWDELVWLKLWFDYKRHWIYIRNEHFEYIEAEKERRENIRKAPII